LLIGNNVTNEIKGTVERSNLKNIQAIVLHRTVSSSSESPINNAVNSEGIVGFHLIIDKDGSITQIVSFNNKANHVGRPTGETSNNNSIGVEVVGWSLNKDGNPEMNWKNVTGWEELTDEQKASAAFAVYAIMDNYNLDMEDVYPHEDVSRKQEGEGRTVLKAIKGLLTLMNELFNTPPPPNEESIVVKN